MVFFCQFCTTFTFGNSIDITWRMFILSGIWTYRIFFPLTKNCSKKFLFPYGSVKCTSFIVMFIKPSTISIQPVMEDSFRNSTVVVLPVNPCKRHTSEFLDLNFSLFDISILIGIIIKRVQVNFSCKRLNLLCVTTLTNPACNNVCEPNTRNSELVMKHRVQCSYNSLVILS